MIEYPLTSYGIEEPEKVMERFCQAGNETLLTLRNFVISPEKRKKPRTWGSIEAAQIIGISAPTFRKLLDKYKDIPGIVIEKNEADRNIKKFTLKAINFLRECVGNRYKRPKGSQPFIIAVSNLKGGVG